MTYVRRRLALCSLLDIDWVGTGSVGCSWFVLAGLMLAGLVLPQLAVIAGMA